MALHSALLTILACPQDKGPLLYFADEQHLYNPRLRRRYRVTNDIPNFLDDGAEDVDAAEHERLVAKADADGVPSGLGSERLMAKPLRDTARYVGGHGRLA